MPFIIANSGAPCSCTREKQTVVWAGELCPDVPVHQSFIKHCDFCARAEILYFTGRETWTSANSRELHDLHVYRHAGQSSGS